MRTCVRATVHRNRLPERRSPRRPTGREALRRLGASGGRRQPRGTEAIGRARLRHSDESFRSATRTAGAHLQRQRIPLEQVLIEGSTYTRHSLKRRLYETGLKARACELCGQGEEWRGASMSLILDHINGVARRQPARESSDRVSELRGDALRRTARGTCRGTSARPAGGVPPRGAHGSGIALKPAGRPRLRPGRSVDGRPAQGRATVVRAALAELREIELGRRSAEVRRL